MPLAPLRPLARLGLLSALLLAPASVAATSPGVQAPAQAAAVPPAPAIAADAPAQQIFDEVNELLNERYGGLSPVDRPALTRATLARRHLLARAAMPAADEIVACSEPFDAGGRNAAGAFSRYRTASLKRLYASARKAVRASPTMGISTTAMVSRHGQCGWVKKRTVFVYRTLHFSVTRRMRAAILTTMGRKTRGLRASPLKVSTAVKSEFS